MRWNIREDGMKAYCPGMRETSDALRHVCGA